MAANRTEITTIVPSVPTFRPDHLGKHSKYVQELSEKYIALSKVVIEEPPSPPRIAVDDQEARVIALRERIQEAWVNADGNPASGKWTAVARLVRMGSISGRHGRWVGARTDIRG